MLEEIQLYLSVNVFRERSARSASVSRRNTQGIPLWERNVGNFGAPSL